MVTDITGTQVSQENVEESTSSGSSDSEDGPDDLLPELQTATAA